MTALTTLLNNDADFLSHDAFLQRYQRASRLQFLNRGLPTKKEEQWKYTDISFLENKKMSRPQASKINNAKKIATLKNFKSLQMVFVDGMFDKDLSSSTDIIYCETLKEAIKNNTLGVQSYLKSHDAKEYPFATLNAALLNDGLFVYIPKNLNSETPIHLLFIQTQNDVITCPRNIIVADEGSEVTLIEEHLDWNAENYLTNVVTTLHAKKSAKINYYKIQHLNDTATHIAENFISQDARSVVNAFSYAKGAKFSRENVVVNLEGENANCSINGFYELDTNGQHCDNHVLINHLVPQGSSEMIYKGVLDNKSRAVFNGKIHVYPGAQKTFSKQANHNLLLSPTAEIDTKPEFEIYADDVKCAHGDTVGQLDESQLFYLRARGIDKDTALKCLKRAFAEEVFFKIQNKAILEYFLHEYLNDE